ncbi:MAG: hypothetical protein QOF18_3011, partial [Frankiaceae bacterium]|nr:hypothetical protein [Frankiaceae bacterium]
MSVDLPAGVAEMRRQMKDFIDGAVIPAEPALA